MTRMVHIDADLQDPAAHAAAVVLGRALAGRFGSVVDLTDRLEQDLVDACRLYPSQPLVVLCTRPPPSWPDSVTAVAVVCSPGNGQDGNILVGDRVVCQSPWFSFTLPLPVGHSWMYLPDNRKIDDAVRRHYSRAD